MGEKTDISWCDSTCNPTTGCDGCELWVPGRKGTCYAGRLHEGRLAKSLPLLYAPDFADVRLAPGRMAKAAKWTSLTGRGRPDKPWLDGLPRHIFVGDMGDVFSEAVPFEYLKTEIIDVALSATGRRHVWMVLTKQHHRLEQFADFITRVCREPWPENVWPGVSVTKQANVGRAVTTACAFQHHYFISAEPLLEAISLVEPFDTAPPRLVIVGGESGPDARPCDLAWVRSLRDQCRSANVAFFFKQAGSRPVDAEYFAAASALFREEWGCLPSLPNQIEECTLRLRDRKGASPEEWPADLRIRQFPEEFHP